MNILPPTPRRTTLGQPVGTFHLITAATACIVLKLDYKFPTITPPKNQVVPASLAHRLLANHTSILKIQLRNKLGILCKLI